MGLTDKQAAHLRASLRPILTDADAITPKEVVTEDATVGNEERLRGIPAVGRVSGTMKGTRPGDSARALEQAGRDIVRGELKRTRRKDYQPEENQ